MKSGNTVPGRYCTRQGCDHLEAMHLDGDEDEPPWLGPCIHLGCSCPSFQSKGDLVMKIALVSAAALILASAVLFGGCDGGPPLQADASGFRWARLDTAARADAPPSDGITPPDFAVSPSCLAIMLKRPLTALAAVPAAAGFELVMWARDPATQRWASFASETLPYDEILELHAAADVYFQIGGTLYDGAVDVGLEEQASACP